MLCFGTRLPMYVSIGHAAWSNSLLNHSSFASTSEPTPWDLRDLYGPIKRVNQDTVWAMLSFFSTVNNHVDGRLGAI